MHPGTQDKVVTYAFASAMLITLGISIFALAKQAQVNKALVDWSTKPIATRGPYNDPSAGVILSQAELAELRLHVQCAESECKSELHYDGKTHHPYFHLMYKQGEDESVADLCADAVAIAQPLVAHFDWFNTLVVTVVKREHFARMRLTFKRPIKTKDDAYESACESAHLVEMRAKPSELPFAIDDVPETTL